MTDYPRDLLINEDEIREFEERIGIRFVNKTDCSKALAEHDAKVRADAYNQALEDFAGKILDWKPQDEEYRNFKDVVNEVKEQLRI